MATKSLNIKDLAKRAAMLLLLLVTSTTAWAKDPFGYVNVCTGHQGSIYLELWALDEDDLSARTTIHVYLRQNGQDKYFYNLGATDLYRADAINPQFAGDHAMHRYLNVPVAGTYDVYVYVLNAAGGGTNPLCEHAWKGAPYPNYASVTTSSPYTVTYNANGGSGAPAATTKGYGINLTLSSTQPTRSGYLFTGWNTAADGSGTTYNSGAAYTGNANLTLYAQWAQSGNNSVEMASGTHDASHWSFSSNTANFGNTMTVNYSGSLLLESVTLRRKTTNTYELNSSNISTAVSNFNSQPGSRLVFNANISEQQTFTCSEGEIDMNGHSSSTDLLIQNNVLGKTITIKNGTVTGTDGAGGFNDYYNGTVVLENMTVTGRVWTDGHPYIINGGTYAEIINDINADTPGTVTIYDGKFSQLGNWGSGGTFTLYGGKYAVNPSSLSYCTIPSGYSVQSNTGSDSGTYPWVVRNTSSPVANPYSLAITEVTANRQWTFTMPSYDVEVVANYLSYCAYNTTTKTFETLGVPNCTAVTTATTTMGEAGDETWYVVGSNATINTRIEVLGTVNLILADGKKLRAEKGIHVPPGATLNIYSQSGGTGELHSISIADGQAGIGGNYDESCGTVTIHGGNIEATGYRWGAGIGGGRNGNGGTIAFYGGTTNATSGQTGAGIGGGVGANCGNLTIVGGTVIAQAQTAYEGDESQAIGSGAGSGVSAGTMNILGMKVYSSAGAANPVAPANRMSTCQSKYARLTPCTSHNFVDGACAICGAYSPLTYLEYQTWMHTFEEHTFEGDYTIVDATTTVLGADNTETWYAVRNNVTTNVRIEVRGSVHLILCDGKTLTTTSGIMVNAGNNLTIYGQSGGTGTLNASAYNTSQSSMPFRNAGIGSNNNTHVGDIIIHGGNITAEGNAWSAGIGGGMYGGSGSVTIYGGNVSAKGHDGGAEAIGHGNGGADVAKNIEEGLRFYVSGNLQTYNYLSWSLSQSGQPVMLTPCTEHTYTNGRCIYCNHSEWYTVTYNGNSHTGGIVPTDATHYLNDGTSTTTVQGNTGNMERTGYTFVGWNTKADGSGINFAPDETFTIYGNVTLYAKWIPISYTVRFHKNHPDATGTMSDQTFTYDVARPLRTNAFTLGNYQFVGWNTRADGTAAFTDHQNVSNLANEQDAVVNLYAMWTQNIFSITYDLAGGSVATPNPTTYTDMSSDITLVNPTREGYGFIGWTGGVINENENENPQLTVTIPAGSTGNRSYTANWRQGVVYYAYNTTVNMFESFTLFDNYTSVTSDMTSMSSGLYVVDDDVTISDRIEVTGTVGLILCDGKTLTATNGFSVLDGNTLNIYGQTNGTGTLTATNSTGKSAIGSGGGEKSGTVTIHGGAVTATGDLYAGGIGCGWWGQVGTIVVYGGTVTATGGGYGAGLGGGRDSQCGDVIILGGTVVASSANNPPLVYGNGVHGGGSLTLGNVKVFYPSHFTNPVAYTDRVVKCTSVEHNSVRVETCTSHNWENNTCTLCGAHHVTVTYNGNGATAGSVPYDAFGYEPSQTFTVLGNTGNLVRTGYTFSGWNSAADGKGMNFAPGATFTINGDITLYAQWSPITYTVRFNKNHDDATGTMSNQTFTFDVQQALSANAFSRDGYLFAGWTTSPVGSVSFSNQQNVCNLANEQNAVVNLYALWVQNIYTITYDLAGGWYPGVSPTEESPNPTTYSELNPDIILVNPTRGGYLFAGWTGGVVNDGSTSSPQDPETWNMEPETTVTIPAGSTGNRSYTAQWDNRLNYMAYNTTTHALEPQLLYSNRTLVTLGTTSMTGGWYVVDDDVTISSRITVSGTVNLILCDGKTLTASAGITVSEGNTLNIYAQSGGSGTLLSIVSDGANDAGIGSVGNSNSSGGTINIHGGNVTASSGNWSAGIGGGVNMNGGNVNIYGGTVNATGHDGTSQAIGHGSSGSNAGSCTIANGLRVTVNNNSVPVAYADRVSSLGNHVARIEPCSEHNMSNGSCTYCGGSICHVTYNGNNATGGTVPTDASDYISSQTVTVMGNLGNLERTGYIFGGWNTQADGRGINYAPGATFGIGISVTLYAKWEVHQLELANNADNNDAIDTAAGNGMHYEVTLAGRTLYRDGDWNTLCLPFEVDDFSGTPLEGATVKTLTSSDFAGGTLTMNFSNDLTSIEAGKPYIVKWTEEAMYELDTDIVIRSVADWNTFASNVNNGTESYAGKTVKLANDISASKMVGTDGKEFKGTFDGCGHTLTFNYTTDADNAAPFQWIKNAVIKNLTVMGEIRSSKMFAAGFVARAYGDNAIENCVSSVTIHATKVGDGTHGGFVGRIESDCKTFTFTDCKFNGTFDGSNTDNWCPFAAWSMGNDNTHFTFNNCLYAPASTNVRGGCATFYRNGTATLNGAYYTQTIGTVQGTNASGMSNETLVSNLGSGWEISNGQVVPKMENSIADIVAPVFSNVLISDATANISTDHANFIGSYAPITDTDLLLDAHNPNGDAMHAAISITQPSKTGYTFGGWYTDAALTTPATAIPFTTNGNVTLYAKWLVEELELVNNGDNSDAISTAAASGLYHNVTLADRTIYKDGDWNTLCLPFNLGNAAAH